MQTVTPANCMIKRNTLNPAGRRMLPLYFNMTDIHTAQQRSHNMQQIKGKKTKPEMLVRKFLHANGYRYKLHDKNSPANLI